MTYDENLGMQDELLDNDMAQLLELTALQQKFAEPDDELTAVIEGCSQPGGKVAGIATESGRGAAELRQRTTIMAAHQLPRGTVLNGRYTVGEVLGQGGFGITYAAQDLVLNVRVAIKEYYPTGYVNRDSSQSYEVVLVNDKERDFVEKGRERFLEEARALAKFQNLPGVVGVQSYFEQNGTAYIAMEYLEGTDLRRYLDNNLPFDADDIFQRMQPVMDALEQIHAAGMLHRDISPDNIMLLSDGSLKLTDFGAARLIDYDEPRTVSIVLKPGYTPEEQYLPKGKLGPWTDIYALCATLYRCITGAAPEEALQRAYEDEIEWPSELGFEIAPEQEAVLKKGMATRPENRFQTVAQMRRVLNGEDSAEEALEQLEQAQAAAAGGVRSTATKPAASVKPKRRKMGARGFALIALAVLLAGIAAFFGLQWLWQPKLSATELAIVVGSKAQVELQNANGEVEWRTDDRDVLDLKADGAAVEIEGKEKGKVKLMAVSDGRLYECVVTVDKPRLSKKALSLRKGDHYILELKGTEADISWKSSEPEIVEVSVAEGGKATLTAKKTGKATVRAKVAGVTYKCKVTVTAARATETGSAGQTFTGELSGGSDDSGNSGDSDDSDTGKKTTKTDTDADDGSTTQDEGSSTADEPVDDGSSQTQEQSGETSSDDTGAGGAVPETSNTETGAAETSVQDESQPAANE